MEDDIICPHCGHKQEVVDWHDWAYHDGDKTDYECDKCGNIFEIEVEFQRPDFKVVK